jgi:hypothetical protein
MGASLKSPEKAHFSSPRRVEEGRGSECNSTSPFPFPAHQTGRAHFEHPAFRQISPTSSRTASPKHVS